MRQLAAMSDANGHEILLRPFSDQVFNIKANATTEAHVSVPSGATRVILNGTAAYYCKIGPTGTTAAIPSGNVTDGSGSTIQSAGYSLSSTDTVISIISPSAIIVSLEFYD